MSRTKLLLDVVTDLQNLAGSLQTIAGVLASNEESPRTEEKAPVKKAKPEKQKISLEEVRTLLAVARMSKVGYINPFAISISYLIFLSSFSLVWISESFSKLLKKLSLKVKPYEKLIQINNNTIVLFKTNFPN